MCWVKSKKLPCEDALSPTDRHRQGRRWTGKAAKEVSAGTRHTRHSRFEPQATCRRRHQKRGDLVALLPFQSSSSLCGEQIPGIDDARAKRADRQYDVTEALLGTVGLTHASVLERLEALPDALPELDGRHFPEGVVAAPCTVGIEHLFLGRIHRYADGDLHLRYPSDHRIRVDFCLEHCALHRRRSDIEATLESRETSMQKEVRPAAR